MSMRRRFLAVLGTLLLLTGLAATPAAGLTGNESISAVAASAKPSVVGILTTLKANRSTDRGRAAGTGWVYKEGVIVTNAHVVKDGTEVRVLYADKTVETVTADNISLDEVSDVAVIRVLKKGLKVLPFANSDAVTVGQTVIAVGNPLGFRLGNSVTAGILSGTGRALGSGYPFLQMDAPINPGNSGGPLFNLNGEVIGINSAKMADIGVEGLSFAIPINTARKIADTLLADGKVERATMGIELDEGWEAYFGVPDTEGVTIQGVIQDGPAGLSGLRSNDKLIKLDDVSIFTTDDVSAFMLNRQPGDYVTLTVRRSGQVLSVSIRLGSQDELRKAAEEQGVEVGGILLDLTPGQVQEAAEFGRMMAMGRADVNRNYVAVSGSNYAVLFTEYLHVARRTSSALEFGFEPGVGFQQAVARDIRNKLEIQMELNGTSPKFLEGATFSLKQGSITRSGTLTTSNYISAADNSVVIANAIVRFSSSGLSPTEDLTVTVTTADKKNLIFRFTIDELR